MTPGRVVSGLREVVQEDAGALAAVIVVGDNRFLPAGDPGPLNPRACRTLPSRGPLPGAGLRAAVPRPLSPELFKCIESTSTEFRNRKISFPIWLYAVCSIINHGTFQTLPTVRNLHSCHAFQISA